MNYAAEVYAQPALVSSQELAWRGIQVEHYRLAAAQLPPHHHAHHLLLLYQAPVAVRRQLGTRVQEARFQAGDLGLYPGGEYGPVAWNAPIDNVHLCLDALHLEQLARQGMDLTHFALRDRFRFDDPLPGQLGRQLLSAVGTHHALGLLYVESLTTALCHHLIEHHAAYERRVATGGRLPGPVLARIDAYLEAHAAEVITLEALAGLAHLSVFHFARRFKQTTQVSPYQYVLSWKIRRAQHLLRAGAMPIAGIGEALGFASLAHFSAAFKRVVGVSPRAFQWG